MRASASTLAAAPLAPLFTAAMADAAGTLRSGGADIPVYRGEFWTAKQRQATPIHEVSYRACFKPQLPAYFISRLTAPGDAVYDPFSGRGTTAIEAALHGRRIVANDVNPLSAIFTRPRLAPPTLDTIAARLAEIDLDTPTIDAPDLSMFFHARTLREIGALRAILRLTVVADAYLTAPAVVFQALSGLALMHLLGWPFASAWSIAVWCLYVLVGVCWLPVVAIQVQLKREAERATSMAALSAQFHRRFRWWFALGIPAFAAVLVIFYLMVAKPLAVTGA